MTYRSNPFDKQDYSKFAFKKSELLAILQAIDENFSFDSVNTNPQENKELLHIEANSNTSNDYRFFLFKKPLLTFHEAACIMTGYDPQYVEQCQNDTNFKQNFSNYLGAKDYIDTCCDAQMLCYNPMNNRIDAKDFKQFLANDGTFINGFNDQIAESSLHTESIKVHEGSKATIANLELRLAIEQLTVENLSRKIECLRSQIAKLEAPQAGQEDCLLSQIFDDSATERYAPDLANSIKLWECLYIENKGTEDKHSNRANHWILKNTPYRDIASVEVKRLREITSPFDSWHIDRKNKFNK